MPATIDMFRSLAKILDDVVLKVDADLPAADDIHPAVAKIGIYLADLVRLPAAVAKLEAQKATAAAGIPTRDKAVRKARHAVTMIDAKLKKLGESIDHHRAALSDADDEPVPTSSKVVAGLALPTRKDRIEELRVQILAAEEERGKAQEALKRAEAFRKGVDTRLGNLDAAIAEAKKAVADHAARLDETVRLLRKTINHLRNRQANRDRKRAACGTVSVTVPGADDADGPLAALAGAGPGPTDEDIRKMCEEAGLPIDGPEDIAAARQLFCE